MSFVLGTSTGKSHLVHVIDTPGHVNFLDEVATAIRLADGILLVVDVLEGVCFLIGYPTFVWADAAGFHVCSSSW